MTLMLFYSLLSAIIVSFISLIGIILLFLKIESRKIVNYLVGFATGALFADVFFHIFPEIFKEAEPIKIGLGVLLGIFGFFILEEIICWRHCHIETSPEHPHPVAFMNLIGDGLHNFFDGLAISISYLANFSLGLTTTLAVIFHEIPQEIGDFGVLLYAGYSKKKALFVNFLSALTAILGVFIPFIFQLNEQFNLLFLSFMAGGFIYIAGSDLVPLIKNKRALKNSLVYLLMMIFGALLMYLLLFLE